MKTNMSCGTAFLYLIGAILIPHSIILINWKMLDWYLLTFFLFFAPAFFICFLVFIVLDWGLKKLFVESSLFGLIPVILVLSTPFILLIKNQSPTAVNDCIIMFLLVVMILLWSVFVVDLQLQPSPAEEAAKPKNTL